MKKTILITGAVGTTGNYALNALLNTDYKIKAMVKQIDERSNQLKEKGVEIIKGDFLDYNSINNALKSVNRAYFCYPFKNQLPKAAAIFAKAAKENNVECVVAMSQMNAHKNSTSPATQNHLLAESILDWANIGAVHLRPGLFAWNYLGMAAPTVKQNSSFYFPNEDSAYTIVHPKDIGEVIASILTSKNLDPHIGNRYLISGPEIYTSQKVVKTIGKITNKEVTYVPIPVDVWIDSMKELPTVNEFLANHLKEFSKDIADGWFDIKTNVIKHITGKEPRTFEQYIEEHKELFN